MGYRMTKEESLLEQYRNRCDSLARENAALRVEVTALKVELARLATHPDPTVGNLPRDLG